jgi:hypothetical protein
MRDPATRDRDQVLAQFIRDGKITLYGVVDHDAGDSTIVIDGVDVDQLLHDVAWKFRIRLEIELLGFVEEAA